MLNTETQKIDPRLFLLPLFVLLVPLILFFGVRSDPPIENEKIGNEDSNVKRVVIVIVDALRKSNIEEDMPRLKQVSNDALYLPLDTCLANFTLPCIQTLLEGRESSPVSAMHNFTGSKSNRSILSLLSKNKWRIETYSDHTLGALFSDLSQVTENGDTYPVDLLQKDLQLIEKAKASLQENRDRQIIILHVPGTDKKVHGTPVGGEEYRKHFNAVDVALGDLIDTLDFENDFLFISGDHGHNDKGFHIAKSVAILKGPSFFELDKIKTPRLAAVDLVFWLSFGTNTVVTEGYEGRNFWLTDLELNPQKSAFQSREESRLRSQSLTGSDLGALLDAQQKKHRRKAIISTINVSSILLLFLALILAVLFPNPRWKGKEIIGLGLASLLSFAFFLDVEIQIPALIYRVVLFCIAFFFIFYEKLKVGLLTISLFIISLSTAFFDTDIQAFFYEGDGGDFVLIVYGSAMVCSLLAGLLFFPSVLVNQESEASLDLEGKEKLLAVRKSFRLFVIGFSGLFGMFALNSGGYFYSSSTNYFNMFFFVGGVVLLSYFCIYYLENKKIPSFQKSKTRAFHLAVFISILVLLQFTDDFNWRWVFLPTKVLKAHPIISYGLVLFSLVYFWWSVKDKHAYYVRFLPFFIVSFIYTSWAGLSAASFAVSLLPSLLLVAFFSMREPSSESVVEESFETMIVYTVIYAATWLAMDGFDISNIDFTYIDKHFPEYVSRLSTDSDRLLFYAPFTLPKYLLTSVIPLFVFYMMRGHRPRTLLYVLGILIAQIVFLVGDVVLSISAGSVLAGAAVDDLLFIWLLSLALTIVIIFGLLVSKYRKEA